MTASDSGPRAVDPGHFRASRQRLAMRMSRPDRKRTPCEIEHRTIFGRSGSRSHSTVDSVPFKRHQLLSARACRRTTTIREVACFIRLVAGNSALARSLCAGFVFDEPPSASHRRGRGGATRGGSAYGAYRCATNGGGGWGPGHMGNVGVAHTLRTFAILRKVQPSSPSACRAAASCEDLHSM
jgi:hypothetical protein